LSPNLVSFVIPVFNEEANLSELIERALKVGTGLNSDFEIVLIDDGSSDGSEHLIREAATGDPAHVTGVFLNRNYGQHAAVRAGLAAARGDVVITLNADLQNPPEEIPKLLDAIRQGYDIVGGVRRKRKDSVFRKFASHTMNGIMRRLGGLEVGDYGCMLRAYRRGIVDAILACQEHSAYIPALANSFAGRMGEVTVEHAERGAGTSKYSIWSLLNLYFDLLVSAATIPLRLLSIAGTALALVGAVFGFLLLVLRFVYGPGWAAQGVFTIFAVLFVLLGVQLIGMGLLGEYIGRISRDVQGRPPYLVRETVGGENARRAAAPSKVAEVPEVTANFEARPTAGRTHGKIATDWSTEQ
jgi:undecaprenyl-phosphate 4-deoxy-4-formamido-L-arabinose transferase